mmetsp:Transcript_16222/g.37586  ORF Transcript_16222/g.37586 Transcript_16222/m.37586 type:complete len:178 (-) Transcript_16222:206-739(-)
MAWVECDMWQMRAVPLALGTLLVPFTHCACRLHGASQVGGLVAAFFVATDTLFFALSRTHLSDVVVCLFIAATVACHAALLRAVKAEACQPPRRPTGRRPFFFTPFFRDLMSAPKIPLLVLVDGICLGLAISAKFGTVETNGICAQLFSHGPTPPPLPFSSLHLTFQHPQPLALSIP